MAMRNAMSRKQPNAPSRGSGRPSEYSDKIAERLCDALSNGASLRKACATKGMPAPATVYRWLRGNREFREQYARAREMQADRLFDEILEIADNTHGDVVEIKQEDGSSVVRANHANVHRARLQVDARKWIAAKLAPRKYGDHTTVSAPGLDDEGKPLVPVINLYGRPAPGAVEREQERRERLDSACGDKRER
jgi:hypothetical protein